MAKSTNKNAKKNNKNLDSTSFKSELKRVNWASPEELAKSTMAVIVLVIFVALVIFISDTIFSLGINKYTDFVVKRTEKPVENVVEQNNEKKQTINLEEVNKVKKEEQKQNTEKPADNKQ